VPWLIQAHGWAQVQGWAGLFVAGMGLRLLPRFAGRQPIRRPVALAVFALLFSGVVARVVAQSFDFGRGSEGLIVASALLSATGALAFSALVLQTLIRGRNVSDPWRWFCMAGGAWWAVWAVVMIAQGFDAARNHAYVPAVNDDATAWAVLLAAIGNFIWGVQSRAVPIFFGRKTPTLRRALMPGVTLNLGAAVILVAAFAWAAGSASSAAAFAFLVVFGSIVAFTAYGWLLRSGAPSVLVSTYAYVNPAVAVLLGWAFAGEAVGNRELAAGAIVVASVGMLVLAREPHEQDETPLLPETVGPYLRHKEAQERPFLPAAPRLVDLRRIAP
jgi:drug/metabolite transporter (DMT)-like permease